MCRIGHLTHSARPRAPFYDAKNHSPRALIVASQYQHKQRHTLHALHAYSAYSFVHSNSLARSVDPSHGRRNRERERPRETTTAVKQCVCLHVIHAMRSIISENYTCRLLIFMGGFQFIGIVGIANIYTTSSMNVMNECRANHSL